MRARAIDKEASSPLKRPPRRRQGAGSGTTYETFGYDPLNRLVARNRNAAATTVVASYSTTGNILSKTDVGGAASGAYAYGSSKPHAATSAWGYAIGYDANGNMSSRSKAGETWHFSWTAFDKPKNIAAGPKGSAFLYDAENRRVVHERFDAIAGGVPTHLKSKKIYVGSQMEVDFENVAPTGAADFEMSRVRIYIDAPDGRAGAYELDPRQPASTSRQAYLYHQDHLGSVDAITKYENATSGAPSYAHDGEAKDSLFSYDPWGQRRDPLDWSGPPAATSGSNPDATLTPRGFTDHEMLDDLGLVHMNGRIYDPLLGRFLSADRVVQFPDDLQSYNRYSYVSNNPLSNTDPSGYEKKSARFLNLIKAKRNTLNNLESRISNVEQRIQTRIGQHKENPRDLPEDAGPNAKPSEDRVKHRRLINEDKALVADLKGQLSVAKDEIVQLGKSFAVARAAEKAAAAAEKASAKAAGKKVPFVKVLMLGVIVPELIDEVEARIEEDDVGGAIREVVGQLEPTGLAEEGPNIMENVGDIVGTLGDLVGVDLGPNPFDREDASSDTDEEPAEIVPEDVSEEKEEEEEEDEEDE